MATLGEFKSEHRMPNLHDSLSRARAQTDALFEIIRPEALYDRPIAERHRLIFYLGHLEAFDWNQICRGALGFPSFHPAFDKLFEFGIDPEPGSASQDKSSDWPRMSEVLHYRVGVRARVDEALDRAPAQIVNVAIEHRLMHAETFAYLMHELPYAKKRTVVGPHGGSAESAPNPMIRIPAGEAALGQCDGAFGWDNEFPLHRVRVGEFWIAQHKVTNGDYLRFIEATGAKPPHFWTRDNGRWMVRGMFGTVPLPLDWPVYVTHDEAAAYAGRAGKQLPSETHFHRAAYGTPSGQERAYPWGDAPPEAERGNFDFHRWDPVGVAATPRGDSAFGVSQLTGNGWEWTATPFAPFEGFQPFPFYPGYSAGFFDGRHFILKGGSPRTASELLRRSFRNWFRPNYPYVYATFRLVSGD
jgi:formylglycine-generating enzyme required for sulfatase activity